MTKIRLKIRKKTFLIISIVVIIILIVTLFLPSCISSLKFKTAKSEFKDYFLNEFEIPTIESTKRDKPFDYYENTLVRQSIKYLENRNALTPTEYLDIAKDIKASFRNECTEGNFEDCDPYKILMPYCMTNRTSWLINGGDLEVFKKEINEDIVYSKAIEYWKTYIEEKELEEDDLSAFIGVVVSEKLCGDLDQNDSENLLEKLLKIEINENQSIEKIMHSLKKKVSVIRALQDPNYFSQFSQNENLKYSICNKIPSIEEIRKTNDVCAVYNYYIVKTFCDGGLMINSTHDYSLITKHLEEKYFDLEKIVCQMGIYQLGEK